MRGIRNVILWLNGLRQYEGWYAMLQNLLYFIKRHIYITEHYWIFSSETGSVLNRPIDEVRPRVPVSVIFVNSNEEADRLERSGLRFRHLNPHSYRALDIGTWCALMVVDHTVASAGWLFTSEAQRTAIDEARYAVDWEHGEGVSSHVYTLPKYRRLHLRVYSVWVRAAWLYYLGFTKRKSAILKQNQVSLIGVSWYPDMRLTGEAEVKRILGRMKVKERPICNA